MISSRYAIFALMIIGMMGCTTINNGVKHMADKDRGQVNAREDSVITREIQPINTEFNQATGVIRYTLPEPAIVRIRIGLPEGGPLLWTLIDWEFRKAGTHEEIWDKKDLSGAVDFSQYDNFVVLLACLPANQDERKFPALTIRGFRKAPDFTIRIPDQDGFIKGVPVVRGGVPIRVELSERDKKWVTESRYEITFFIDEVFLSEDEEGSSPFTYALNTDDFNEGFHTVTVNVASFSGEVGARSKRFYVKPKK